MGIWLDEAYYGEHGHKPIGLVEFCDSGLATTRVREATAPNSVKQPSLDTHV